LTSFSTALPLTDRCIFCNAIFQFSIRQKFGFDVQAGHRLRF
jgi:hypothetical protein